MSVYFYTLFPFLIKSLAKNRQIIVFQKSRSRDQLLQKAYCQSRDIIIPTKLEVTKDKIMVKGELNTFFFFHRDTEYFKGNYELNGFH